MTVLNPPVIHIMGTRLLKLAFVGGLMFGLSACGGVQGALGLGKQPPDEFAVVTKAPLIVPPDFSLRPPRPGSPRPQELQPTETARRALLGEEFGDGEDGPSQGEVSLLMKAGADRVDPNIRKVLSDESGKSRQKDQGFSDNVLFWQGNDGESASQPTESISSVNEPPKDSEEQKENKKDDEDGGGGFFKSIGKIF